MTKFFLPPRDGWPTAGERPVPTPRPARESELWPSRALFMQRHLQMLREMTPYEFARQFLCKYEPMSTPKKGDSQ